jgi:hypothetical protein
MKKIETTIDITKEVNQAVTERIAVIRDSIVNSLAEYYKRIYQASNGTDASKWANITYGLEHAITIIDMEEGIEKVRKE